MKEPQAEGSGRNNYTRGRKGAVGVRQWVAQKKNHFFWKKLTVPKIVAQYGKESFPIFVHCRTHSACAQNRKTFGSQSELSITSSESNTVQLRQPIRNEYYVTRVVSQSESTIMSPELSLRHPRALG